MAEKEKVFLFAGILTILFSAERGKKKGGIRYADDWTTG